MFNTEHIDPRKGVLISGLENSFNEIITDGAYNNRKNNRFVPYRVCEYPAPVTFGDVGEFLIEGEWVVCEFGGLEWWAESNRVGNSQVQKPFKGKKRTQQWKEENSKRHKKNWETRDKEQIKALGKGTHKRNPKPGQQASAKVGRAKWRLHWSKELFEEIREKYLNRTSYHWGRKQICEKYNVSAKTVENIVKHIREGKTFLELTIRPEAR